MKNMIKQNLIEVHTNQGRKGIAKVMNTRGQYIYVINSSELSYSLFDVEKTTFYSWNQAWEYFKKTTENWQSFLPTLINGDIKNILRPITIGIKNYLFICSKVAALNAAMYYFLLCT